MLVTREATEADAELIARQRRRMFEDAVLPVPTTLQAMEEQFVPWVRRRLADGSYLGWIVEEDKAAIGGAGLWVMEFPPHFLDVEPRRGYLLNFYVEPAYRGRGLARELLARSIGVAKERGLRVISLHASKFGRPIYEASGFRTSNEMLYLTDDSVDVLV